LDCEQLYQKAVAGMPLFIDLAKIIVASNVWDGATSRVPLEPQCITLNIIWSKIALAVLKQQLKLLHSK